ncbi:hypothetical protein OS493_023637 [Desmophyllum pertusum]|uniref:Uncharacterized protein n=1 Tax=Desmophyllum pertusum TaxID=174260 RepID=A0A9W9ZB87_9CNID|nr:hypothetical protein OS493_023637 [Desmophyllum pertusum]
MPHGKGKGRKNRERNRNTDVEQIVEVHPALHFFISGNVNFANGAFLGALQDFSTALGILDLSFGPARQLHQLRVETLLGRAHCFFILGILNNSIRDGAEAFNLSQEIGFQEGIYGAIQLNLLRCEHTDDIGGAFQLALLLKTIDSKKAKAHVGRLRDKVECVFREDPTLVDKLRDNLMSCGIKLFDKRSFKQAAEYFTEVVRLFCEFSFVREAYVYQAKCHFEMEKYEEARNNVKKVLEHHPDDEEGKKYSGQH